MRINVLKFVGLICLALFFASAAHADTAQMVFTGPNSSGINDGQYYVSPYYGTMNGVAVTLFCDDVLHEVFSGEKWTANVTNLGTALSTVNGLGNTRFGAGNGTIGGAQLYEEVAWLVTQFTPTDQNEWVSIQHAIWDLTDPSAHYTDVGLFLYDAGLQSNYQGINPNDFLIVTDQNYKNPGSVQEFIVETVQTPEPSSLVLLISGMLAMMLLVIRRGRI